MKPSRNTTSLNQSSSFPPSIFLPSSFHLGLGVVAGQEAGEGPKGGGVGEGGTRARQPGSGQDQPGAGGLEGEHHLVGRDMRPVDPLGQREGTRGVLKGDKATKHGVSKCTHTVKKKKRTK